MLAPKMNRGPELRLRPPAWKRDSGRERAIPEISDPLVNQLKSNDDREHLEYMCRGAVAANNLQSAHALQGLEYVFPFCDLRLIGLMMRIPSTERMRPPRSKWLLREAMRGSIPERIRVKTRQPTGAIPMVWKLRASSGSIRELLGASRLDGTGLVSKTLAINALDRILQGDVAEIASMMNLLSAELWLHRIQAEV